MATSVLCRIALLPRTNLVFGLYICHAKSWVRPLALFAGSYAGQHPNNGMVFSRHCVKQAGLVNVGTLSRLMPSRHAHSQPELQEKAKEEIISGGSDEVVYIGTMSRLVRIVKMFSLSTSVFGVCIQPMLYNEVADLHWAVALSIGLSTSFFVFMTPLLLHIVSKRYVTKLLWNKEDGKFVATTYSFLLREINHKFTAEEVTVPTTPHLFTTVLVRNPAGKQTPLFLDPGLFLNTQALVHLLKYNEPLDWEITEEKNEEHKEPQNKSER